MIFRLFTLKFFVAATKPNSKRNKTGFILYSPDYPPLNSRVKIKQVFNFFFMLGLIPSIKRFKQNRQENIVQCWFYETSIKILRLISNAPSQLLLICRQIPTLVHKKTILYYTMYHFGSQSKTKGFYT